MMVLKGCLSGLIIRICLALTVFAKKPDHFRGHTKTVRYFDESRSGENTDETKEMVTTVQDKLDYMFKSTGRHYDALLQLEEANGRARADLVVNGVTIMKDVPATFLLGMETRLKGLRDVLMAIPTLEMSTKWEADKNLGKGKYRAEPAVTMKGEKTLKSRVLVDPTKEHPAQVQQWNEDVPVARTEVTHTSSMITPSEKSTMLGRIDALISGVKKARQRANCVETKNIKIAKDIFAYILG
jgi:hypothetical protein